VEIRLLGRVAAAHAGRPVELGPSRQRFVFAVLALEVGRPVPAERLIQLAWPDDPPRTAGHAIQVYVSGLRSALARAGLTPAEAEIRSAGGTYTLVTDPATIDAHRFQAGLAAAGRLAGDPARVDALTEALELWAGPPLSAAGPERSRQRLSVGLVEARLTALEDRIDARLRLGEHHAVLAELAVLTEAHPERERLLAQRMLALYRGERAAEALAVYRQTRDRLGAELGLDPGPRLRELELAILRNDPGLAAPPAHLSPRPAEWPAESPPAAERPAAAAQPAVLTGPPVRAEVAATVGPAAPAGPAGPGGLAAPEVPAAAPSSEPPPRPAARNRQPVVTVPRQLPPDTPGFAGRRRELAELDRLLTAAVGRSAPAICAVSGTGGVGKTAFALHWAHRVADRFPDGQLYVDLRGFDPAGPELDPVHAVRQLLDGLGVPVDRLPGTPEAQTGLYRSLLADRRVLVVLDNARDERQLRPLLPGAAGCFVLVTSRRPLTGLVAAGAHAVPLGRLSADEARELLTARLGARRVLAEPGPVAEIARRCAWLPLALAVAAARAVTRPDVALAAVVAELRAAEGSLDAFESADPATDLRTVLASSHAAVSEPARRLFRLLALHPGPSFGVPAAASLAGLPPRPARALLAELAGAHLLGEPAPGRYDWHDLLHAYALEQLDGEPEPEPATDRLLDHLVGAASAASLVLDPHRDAIDIPPPVAGVTLPDPPADHTAALDWFVAEHETLVAAVDVAAARGRHRHAWQLAWALNTYLYRQGHWWAQEHVQRAGVAAARRVGDRFGEALGLRNLALADVQLGRLAEGQRNFTAAADLLEQAGAQPAHAHTLMNLAYVVDRQGHTGQALAYLDRALTGYLAIGHQVGQARALSELAVTHLELGDHRAAAAMCRQALAIHQELNDLEGEATAWDTLGDATLRGGDAAEAVRCYRQSIRQRERLGDRHSVGKSLGHLGEALAALGDLTAARTAWLDSVGILDELGHADAARFRALLDTQTPATAG
jgi:DNA-binding SARP family transcriptional activator/tetratricopeptide (TPR) repeat protein